MRTKAGTIFCLSVILPLSLIYSPPAAAQRRTPPSRIAINSEDERNDPKTAEKKTVSGAGDEAKGSSPSIEDRLKAMEQIIERQQREIQTLREMVEKRETEAAVGVRQADAATFQGDQPHSERTVASKSASDASAGTAASQQQGASIGDRLQKVEERIAKFGPIRFGGDFRFRLDGILRPATRPPDPPLQHVQNIRMRYRLRLNLDSEINKAISFHGQLSTGPINNGITQDQDFTATVAHHPFFISEAWMDYHPNKNIVLQGGRVQEVFADNSRFLFDDDVRFNGFNERFILPFGNKGTSNMELRAAQYWFSNPNVAVVTAGSPLAVGGDEVGKIGRSSNLFHQGLLLNLKAGENSTHQLGGDIQVFREPNQIQLASTANGVVFLVQPGLGLVLSGPMTGTGNATTTAGGAIYTAEDFHIGRLTYRLSHAGFKVGEHAYPISFNVQVARNFGTSAKERDALLAAIQVGKPAKFGDMSFLYVLSIKGANSIISQLTDDDLGTGTGVNLRTHYVRWELGLAKNITLQSLLFVQRELRNSGQFPNFFVPLGAFTPRQYRFQEH